MIPSKFTVLAKRHQNSGTFAIDTDGGTFEVSEGEAAKMIVDHEYSVTITDLTQAAIDEEANKPNKKSKK